MLFAHRQTLTSPLLSGTGNSQPRIHIFSGNCFSVQETSEDDSFCRVMKVSTSLPLVRSCGIHLHGLSLFTLLFTSFIHYFFVVFMLFIHGLPLFSCIVICFSLFITFSLFIFILFIHGLSLFAALLLILFFNHFCIF